MEDGTETRHMIEEIVEKIVAEYAPQKVILFGSYASPIVYTPKELEERLACGDFFIREVLEKGEVLYG